MREIGQKISPTSSRNLDELNRSIFIDTFSVYVLNVLSSHCDVAFNFHDKTMCVGDGKTEIESNKTGDATAGTDDMAPAAVD